VVGKNVDPENVEDSDEVIHIAACGL